MGSIIESLECPKCGQEAYWEFYYKSGEEYINCQQCGYQRKFYIVKDEESEDLMDITQVDYQIEEYGGFGAFRMRYIGSIAYECGSFPDNDRTDFLKFIEDNASTLEYASYTTKENDQWVEKVLIDKVEN